MWSRWISRGVGVGVVLGGFVCCGEGRSVINGCLSCFSYGVLLICLEIPPVDVLDTRSRTSLLGPL